MSLSGVPFETTVPILVAAVSLALALATLITLVLNRVLRTWRRFRRLPVPRVSLTQSAFRFLVILVWLAVSAAVLFLAAFIQSYQRFTHHELAALVRSVPLDPAQRTMYLELTPMRDGQPQAPKTFEVRGDQWAVEGDILKWDDWLNFLGIHTMYRLTRVRGRYLAVEQERTLPPSVYSLVEEQERPQWRWLYRFGHKLKFVSAVYGNTVYTYPSERQVYEVYVTTSGFSVRVREE